MDAVESPSSRTIDGGTKAAEPAMPAEATRSALRHRSRETTSLAAVLVVDDEKTPNVLASQLRALGHEMQIARDAKTALFALARTPFDVVVSDIRTADVDDLALLREVRRRWPDIVVLVTEYVPVAEATEALESEIYDYCIDSFTIQGVGRVLDGVLTARILTKH